MATPLTSNRKTRTACDRCYQLKERCARVSVATVCIRCQRLGLICTTVRPVRQAGRRLRHRENTTPVTTPSSQSSNISNQSLDIGTWLLDVSGLQLEERELLMFLLARPENMENYPISPSFRAAEQRSLAAALPAALPILKHAYLASAGALKLLQQGISTEAAKSISLGYASSAMKTLRSLSVTSSEDAALCLILGASLALFVYSVVGVGVGDICHYCLSTTRPFMETEELSPDMKPWQSVLVLLEIMECLVYRRKPTLRIQPCSPESLDRHVGLCLPLLQHYYDLCDISHSLVSVKDASYLVHLNKQLDITHAAIQSWQPSQPGNFIDQFETAEVVNLLAQARVYRLAGLLVSHRLRYLFGEQDHQADIWSKEIMMELDIAHQITKSPIRCVTLPFIAAAIEIQDCSARIKAAQDVNKYVDQFTPVVQKATRDFLLRVWHERCVHFPCCFFLLFE